MYINTNTLNGRTVDGYLNLFRAQLTSVLKATLHKHYFYRGDIRSIVALSRVDLPPEPAN